MVQNKIQKLIKEEVFQALENGIANGYDSLKVDEPEAVATDLLDNNPDLEGADLNTVEEFVDQWQKEQK